MNANLQPVPLILGLERLVSRDDRAALAALRASLADDAVARAYPYVAPYFPRATNAWIERSLLLVAGLFALHPQSGPLTLAQALRRVRDKRDSASVELRFAALLDAHPDDLASHLRHVVSLVRADDIGIDWHDVARTVRGWHRESARRRWARGFWAGTPEAEGEDV